MIKSGEGDEEDDDDNSNGFHPSVSYYRASEFTKKIHFILWEMTVVKQEAEAAKAVVEKKNLVFLPMMNRKKKKCWTFHTFEQSRAQAGSGKKKL